MAEVWKDIYSYEGIYQVSNLGRVRSLDRQVWNPTRWGGFMKDVKGQIMSLNKITPDGYVQIQLRNCGDKELHLLHRLVASAFILNPEGKRTVNHIDGDKLNNAVENLEWATYAENQQHASNLGLMATGERNGNSKLNEHIVRLIRKDRHSGATFKQLSRKYGIGSTTAHAIATFQTWKHV